MTESVTEDVALGWLQELGYHVFHGPDLAPDAPGAERATYSDVVLKGRLLDALDRLNPDLPNTAIEEAARQLQRVESQNLLEENYRQWRMIARGVPVSYLDAGKEKHAIVQVVDYDNPDNNNLLAVNQFTVVENRRTRRPDIIVFLNGLPVAVFELKSPSDAKATLKRAFNQLQTYKAQIPSALLHNAVLVGSDGVSAAMGSLTAGWDHFSPWKSIDDAEVVEGLPELEVLIRGVFEPARFLEYLRDFVAFVDEPFGLAKKIAKYHQYWAVKAAVESTITASQEGGDGRGGVVWHTQGSGKSFEMQLYTALIMRHAAMSNPTVVVLTDRNDLDDSLFDENFAVTRNLPETPVQATSRKHLRELLSRPSGGIIFTTIQKFSSKKGERYPLLTDRRNVVVLADEAHRSQYDLIDGFARHLRDGLPNATFLGFTGTPIELADRSTRQIFGDDISVYDMAQAVADGATVRIFYESRLAKVHLPEELKDQTDEKVDNVIEGEEEEKQRKLKSRWARLEAILGAEERVETIAADIVDHWEKRRNVLTGKAMVVTTSRRIAVDLYNEIVSLRPEWHSDDDESGVIKVVMTGDASDPLEWQPHIRNKERRRALKLRAKNPKDELELIIVRDMWLTGFDSPVLNTMYVDKLMNGHSLMQAIARVNRVFKDKPGGLIVDYIGIATRLQEALSVYSKTDRQAAGVPLSQAVAALEEKYDVVCGILNKHDWTAADDPDADKRIGALRPAADFVLADPGRKKRYMEEVGLLKKAFALAATTPEAAALLDHVAFFESVRAQIVKISGAGGDGKMSEEDLDTALNQIVSEAVVADGVVDLFAELGGEGEISILSDEFLEKLQAQPHKNLQLELLKRIMAEKLQTIRRVNVVQSRKFSEQLSDAIDSYENRARTTAETIAALVDMAKEIREALGRGEDLGLNDAELAFYDAVLQNDAAVLELGDETLKLIASELVRTLRKKVTVDWSIREQGRAKVRSIVKRLLAKHGYPPDKQEAAIDLVMEQTTLFADNWLEVA